jgi:hypothetical protein
MPNESFKYFIKDKTQNMLTSNIYAYFDFDYSGNYASSQLLTNQEWLNNSGITIGLNNNPWNSSGFLSFNGNNRYDINNLNYSDIGFLFPYYLGAEKKDNIFISSRVPSGAGFTSGYTFGINKFQFPYVHFYDYERGPTTYCLNEAVNRTGILYCAVKQNNIELGYYNAIDKNIKKYSFSKNKNKVYDSKSWKLGGSLLENNQNFLSGKLSQLAIFNPSSLEVHLYEKNIISGLTSELDEYFSYGTISGQSGILHGDVIFVTGCYYYYALSGEFYSGEYQTGISYYTTVEILTDCLGREYNKFTQNVLSGYFSGFRWVNYLTQNCFFNTGYNMYNYDSGFVINYSIKTILPIVKYPELENFYANGIYIKNYVENTDNLSLHALKQINRNIDYTKPLYSIFNKTYSVDGDINISNLSGFYYNGQLQTISKEYTESFENGEVVYLPDKDFFISGSTIFSNKYYDFGNVSIDSWPTFDFVITGSISSGSSMPGVNFGNQMVFLNGQKLISGIDYKDNKILFNIPSGYNVLSITRNKLNFSEKTIINSGGYIFDFDVFTRNTSSVWLNGVRLKNEKDYEEISYVNYNGDIFVKNNGILIYNKNGN